MKAFLFSSNFSKQEFEIRVDEGTTTYCFENSHTNGAVNIQLTFAFDNESGFSYPELVVHQIRVGQVLATSIRDKAHECYELEFEKWKEDCEHEAYRNSGGELSGEELEYAFRL